MKREVEKIPGATWDTRNAARMKLVEEAYQEFRKKWNVKEPPNFTSVRAVRYFELARANGDRVALKYELPSSVSNDLEFF